MATLAGAMKNSGRVYVLDASPGFLGTPDGMCVSWHLMMPCDKTPAPTEQLQLGASIYTRDKLEKKMDAQGQLWYKEFPSLTALSLPAESLSLRQVVSQTYADAKLLAPIAPWTSVCAGAELTPEKTVTGHSAKPDSLSEEQYLQAVKQTLAASEAMIRAAQ